MTTPLFLVALALAVQTPDPGSAAEPDPTAAAAPAGSSEPLYLGPKVRPFEMPAPGGEPSWLPAATIPGQPLRLEAYDGSYEGPKTPVEQIYERGVRGAFDSAQVRMGWFDGEWAVTGADGAPLLVLLLNDPGVGEIEGAWRDLRAGPGAVGAGLLEQVSRAGAGVVVRFLPRGAAEPAELRLSPGADGRLTGELRTQAGRQPVSARRS